MWMYFPRASLRVSAFSSSSLAPGRHSLGVNRGKLAKEIGRMTHEITHKLVEQIAEVYFLVSH